MKRRDSDTQPINMAEMIREYEAAQMARGIVEPQATKSPPCDACRDRALSLDSNDEVPDRDNRGCTWCFGSGAMNADDRRRYAEGKGI